MISDSNTYKGGIHLLENNYTGITKLKDWWGKVKANFAYLDDRISTIITTPVDGVSAQEIIDARKGELALGDKIDAMDLEVSTHKADFVSASQFGAVGDGVTDDGAKLNLAFDYLRSTITSKTETSTVKLDLGGKTYVTTIPLNLTGIISWGWSIENGTIIGKCAGKNVLEMIGSRGGKLKNIVIVGDETNMPYCGILSARSTLGEEYGSCDNFIFDNVSCIGYFSLASAYFYAQESTLYNHCRFWNYNHEGYCAIHTGYDTFPIVSDYMTPVTGGHSFINDKYINVDYRYLPRKKIVLITNITKANPAVVTAANHPFSNGDKITITGVLGMTAINNQIFTVANATTDTFELSGIDTSAYAAYTSGGSAIKIQTVPSVYFARGKQHSFDTCYIVNYGTDSMQIDFPQDGLPAENISLGILFEGSGSRSHIRFTTGNASALLYHADIKTYSTHARDSFISTDAIDLIRIVFYHSKITMSSSVNVTNYLPLVDTASKYSFYGADINTYDRNSFDPKSAVSFKGSHTAVGDGKCILHDIQLSNRSDGTYTPMVTSATGTITSYTATGTIKRVDDLVFIDIDVTITDNGTGTGAINITLPIQATNKMFVLAGREMGVSGKMIQGLISTSAASVSVRDYANAYPASTGARLVLSGWYKATA